MTDEKKLNAGSAGSAGSASAVNDKTGAKVDYLRQYNDYTNSANGYKSEMDAHSVTINDAMNKLKNRSFSYDMDNDPLYRQYRDSYMRQGKMAMQDTIGQTNALSGGYSNSYSQAAGQQTYNNYLQGLNDKVGDLYGLALQKYNADTDALKDEYSMANDAYNRALNMYTTDKGYADQALNNYQTDRNNTISNAINLYDYDKLDAMGYDTSRLRALYQQQITPTYTGSGVVPKDEEDGKDTFLYNFRYKDDKGMMHFYGSDGKDYSYEYGRNPYNDKMVGDDGKTNGKVDPKKVFSNGYQPNNVGGKKLTKTGITDVVNGKTQNVWKTDDGEMYIWDGTIGDYLIYNNK